MTPRPDPETRLLSGLLGATAHDVAEVLEHVHDDDLERPASVAVVTAIRTAVAEAPDAYCETVVLDVLIRRGSNAATRKALLDAVTAGAANHPGALPIYASTAVAGSLRRQVESLGHALTTAAADGAERTLLGQVDAAVGRIRATADRLQVLRGEPA